MIDVSNEIFTVLATAIRNAHSLIQVIGESISVPAVFPCMAIDEICNVPSHLDTSNRESYNAVMYRVQVFASGDKKRAMAHEIFKTVAEACWGMNLIRKTYTTTPDVYNSSIYQISATFEADVRHDGMIFRR